MKIKDKKINLFIPDKQPEKEAIARTTHMGISAHQDDLEVMAYHGILDCFMKKNKWFFGVVVTDGSGSPRNGVYKDCSDEDMKAIRRLEQKKAAYVGEYGALAQLDFKSSEVKDKRNNDVIKSLVDLITAARPEIIYTHNLADKHDTHVAVGLKVIQAIRKIPKNLRPKKIYGCEVWRGLDWLVDKDKIMFDVSMHSNLACSLLGVFDSQITGGKRYDKATMGRRTANATFAESHKTDTSTSAIYSMDLTPLIYNEDKKITEYIDWHIGNFREEVISRIRLLNS